MILNLHLHVDIMFKMLSSSYIIISIAKSGSIHVVEM